MSEVKTEPTPFKSVYRKVTNIERIDKKHQKLTLSCGCIRETSHIKKDATLQTIPQIACVNDRCPEKEVKNV